LTQVGAVFGRLIIVLPFVLLFVIVPDVIQLFFFLKSKISTLFSKDLYFLTQELNSQKVQAKRFYFSKNNRMFV